VPDRPLLSAALIVRDEEHHLDACLRSLAGVVDEVVVVDTGSVDATVAIARDHGATVLAHRWSGDFSAARNRGLDAASGAWILYIDADERLVDHDGLRDVLAGAGTADAVAAVVRFHVTARSTPYLEHRLFRNRPDLRFRSAIHETLLPAIQRIVADEGARVIEAPATILHLGYEGDLTHKHRRNLPLLEAQVARDPQRSYLWFDLGLARRALGDEAGAEQAWSCGVEAARRAPALQPIDLLVFSELALWRLRRGQDASDLCTQMAASFPHDPLVRWVQAQQSMAAGSWAEAATVLEGLVAVDADTVLHEVLAYNRGMFGTWAHHALGTCAFHLGDDEGAARWFALAAAAEPDNQEYEVKRQLAEARARQRSGAGAAG
jgi:hypothetical protein